VPAKRIVYSLGRCTATGQTEIAQQFERNTKKQFNRGMLILMSALVTLNAAVALVQRWHTFALIVKILAIEFLALLVAAPLIQILAQQRGRNGIFNGSKSLIFGYVLAMMAIIIFGIR
jgi:cellobiose-specific phosphotransferase system component IIC